MERWLLSRPEASARTSGRVSVRRLAGAGQSAVSFDGGLILPVDPWEGDRAVRQPSSWLFSDAECREDPVQDIVQGGSPGDRVQGSESLVQVDQDHLVGYLAVDCSRCLL